MPNTDFTPDLSKLDRNYQILTELHGDANSRTYLARHLRLNRDVAITVVQSPVGGEANALTHFAADARLLTTIRHPNVVPVIEGIWLDDKTFAVVRARVRGSTLDQLISAVGPVPIARVATTIEQVNAALEWARGAGIVHRRVTPPSVVFQQGNGRLLVSLDLAPLSSGAMPNECDDAETIGRLAADMLSGQVAGDAESTSAVIVPQIVPALVQAIEAVKHCDRTGAPGAVAGLLSALQAAAGQEVGRQSAQIEPVATAAAIDPEPDAQLAPTPPTVPITMPVVPPRPRPRDVSRRTLLTPRVQTTRTAAVPVSARYDAVVVVKQSFGFNARLGTAIAVAAIIAVMALLVFRHDDNPDLNASFGTNDTTRQAAGDVALGAQRPDSSAMISSNSPAPISSSSSQPAAPTQAPVTAPVVIPRSPITPPDSPRHEPPRTAPPSTFPMPGTPVRDSVTASTDRDACASPEPDDQHKCLMAAIDRNDRELNGVYAKLIAALRRQASAAAGDPDPETVEQLRLAQHKWIDERDVSCRGVGDGPLYAKSRSSCFAQQSANRTREIQRMLDAVPPTF